MDYQDRRKIALRLDEIADYQNVNAIIVNRIRGFTEHYFKVRLGTMDNYGRYTFKPEPIPYKFKEINSDVSISIEAPTKLQLEFMKRGSLSRFTIYQRIGKGMRLIVTRDAHYTYLGLFNMPL